MHCILYARVSTDKQAEKDLSIPAQLQLMHDYARQRGWTVVEEFVEPGASAKTAERPQLQRLLAGVAAGEPKIDIVLVHKLDRWARKLRDHIAIQMQLSQAGVRLASVTENLDDSASGKLIEHVLASFAEFYSENLATEVTKGMRQKVLSGGWPHLPPRGYVVVREPNRNRSHIEVHPKNGILMRSAFELYATGWYSIKALGAKLAKQGLVSKSGGPIAHSHLRALLTNPFYAGRLVWKDLEVEGQHQPLVSLDLFEKVQNVIKRKYRNPGTKSGVAGFPLRGIAICGSCRGNMTAERHDGRWGYYRCGRNAYDKERCRAKFCNAERAHKDLERLCAQIRLPRELAEAIRKEAIRQIEAKISAASEERGRCEAEQTRLLEQEMRLTEGFTKGDISPEVYRRQSTDLRKRRALILERLNRTSVKREALVAKVDDTLKLATSLQDLYDQFPDTKRSELLRSVFSAVVVSADGIAGFTLRTPFNRLAYLSATGKNAASARQAKSLADEVLKAA